MKGDKGVCTAGEIPNQIRKTKFDIEKNAQDSLDFHKGMGFVKPDFELYKCKVCNYWHFGNPEQRKFGK